MSHAELIQGVSSAITNFDDKEAKTKTLEALNAGVDPLELIKQSVQPAMDHIGKLYEDGEIYLPELILAGDAASAVLEAAVPRIAINDQAKAMRGTVVIGVMFGDNHDIGKNLVKALLQAYGFKVIDLGTDVPVKTFLDTALKENADIIASSTLITTSLPYQRQLIELLKASGNRDRFYVILGGGPVNPKWTKDIGADGYGNDAKDAVALCNKLVTEDLKPPLDHPVIVGAITR